MNVFTLKMAQKIQSLLHEDYQDSDIIICNSKIKALIHILYESVKYNVESKQVIKCIKLVITSGKAHGMYSPYSTKTFIFTFNTRKGIKKENLNPEFFNYFCSYTVIHELRHHFQHKKQKYLECAEKDAIKFEYRMMDKYWNKVTEIIS